MLTAPGLLSLFAGALSLALGLWVWRRNQASPAAGSYLLLALTIAAWTIPEGAMRLSDDPTAASGWALVQYMGILAIPPVLLLFLHHFPRSRAPRPWGAMATSGLSALLALALVASAPLAVKGYWWGFAADHEARPLLGIIELYLVVTLGGAGVLGWRRLRSLDLRVERAQLRWYLLGLIPTLVIGLLTDAVQPALLGDRPAVVMPLASVMTLWLVAATAVGIRRYQALLVPPVSERLTIGGETTAPQRGYVYLVDPADRSGAEALFRSCLAAGAQGLVVTVEDEGTLRRRLGLKSTPVVRLDLSCFSGHRHPEEVLERQYLLMLQFLQDAPDPTLYIDVAPALFAALQAPSALSAQVLEMVQGLQRAVIDRQGRLVLVASASLNLPGGRTVVRTRHLQAHAKGSVHHALAHCLSVLLALVREQKGDAAARASWQRLVDDLPLLRGGGSYSLEAGVSLRPSPTLTRPLMLRTLRAAVGSVEAQTGTDLMAALLRRIEALGVQRYEYLLAEGKVYLVQTADRAELMALARLLLALDWNALVISRSAAAEFRTLGATVRSLTPGDSEVPSIKPGLEHLLAEVRRFLQDSATEGIPSLVVLDGLDFLINQNGTADNFPRVLTFLRRLSELVAKEGGITLVPLVEGTIEPSRYEQVRATITAFPTVRQPAGAAHGRRSVLGALPN